MNSTEKPDPIQLATSIYRALVGDRLSDKYKAVERLDESPDCVDFPTLRTLLVKAINDDFYAGREDEQQDFSIARTRSWLLGTLARVSAGDRSSTDLVIRHVDPKHEPYDWARYWSLDGLIAGNNPETEKVAAAAAENDRDPMVSTLATAYLGSKKNGVAVQKIRKSLGDPQKQWFALRALRVVPLPGAVTEICEIVERAEYTDETYDAIMALGSIPADWSHAGRAAQALSASIVEMRGSPWKDGMRTGAIKGLGNLRVESSGPLLVEELADDNPAIVREAARAMERILGLRITVVRIVEAAGRSDAAEIDRYARALRWLEREAVAEELETLMVTGAARQQEIARTLLSELGGAVAFEKLRARTDAMKQYSEVLEKAEEQVRGLFEGSIREAQSGFHIAVVMDAVVFALGIILLLGSAAYTLFGTGDLAKWAGVGVSGGVGVLGVVYGVLISNPRRQVRESVDHLMRLKIVFLAYLRRLHQADQAYTRLLLDERPITVEDVRAYSDAIGAIMEATVRQQVEETSTPKNTPRKRQTKHRGDDGTTPVPSKEIVS